MSVAENHDGGDEHDGACPGIALCFCYRPFPCGLERGHSWPCLSPRVLSMAACNQQHRRLPSRTPFDTRMRFTP